MFGFEVIKDENNVSVLRWDEKFNIVKTILTVWNLTFPKMIRVNCKETGLDHGVYILRDKRRYEFKLNMPLAL